MKLILLAAFCLTTKWPAAIFTSTATQPPKGFAVVELFTSEGCSSCPPADKALANLVSRHPENVFVLGFHVDYWDRLGWRDSASSAAYSSRQQQYAAFLGLNSIYTPQAIVNGQVEFVGSDETRLNQEVEKTLAIAATVPVSMSAIVMPNAVVKVAFKIQASGDQVFNLALVEKTHDTRVRSGENAGLYLHHINRVRDFKTIAASSATGEVLLNLPANALAANYQVIGYLQSKTNHRIVAGTATDMRP